jgi:hypothetical protein
MKAPKVSLDSAKLKQMLLLHVEKIVLGVVLLVVIWFVYQGTTLTSIDSNKAPDALIQSSQQVTNQINDPSNWEKIQPEMIEPVLNHDVPLLVRQGQEPNDPTRYRFEIPWKTPDYPKASLRADPRVFPPIAIKVTPLYGPMAFIPTMADVDPILGNLAGQMGGEMMMQPGMMAPGAMPAGPGPARPGVARRPGPAGGPGPGPGPGGEGRVRRPPRRGGLLDGEMPQEGIPGMEGDLGTTVQMIRPPTPPEAIVGFHPSGEVAIREARAVVVMAAIPLEKQLEEFETAFKEALDYDPMRDLPRYVLFRVERADVTADPSIDPAQATWESLQIARALNEMVTWAPSPNEVVDPMALDPFLTHRIPPFMQRDIVDILTHPEIPKAQLLTNSTMGPGGEGLMGPEGGPPVRKLTEEELLRGVMPGANGMPGGPGGEGMMPGGMRQPGGFGPPGGMMMPPGGMMGPGGYGEGGMMGQSGMPGMVLAKYKLLRFTDTSVMPNRKYRYRVKMLMEDPNNPYVGDGTPPRWDPQRSQPLRKPSPQSLSPVVQTRIRDAETKNRNLAWLLESEPSEPSEIVELPEMDRFFVGKASPAGGSPVRPNTPPVYTTQPSANLLTVSFDTTKAVDVPAEKDVLRGSVLNFEKEVEVYHPSKLVVAPIGKHTFKTDAIVVDFTGGSDIPPVGRADTKVQEPCQMLLVDKSGNLRVLEETDDIEGFRRYLPPKLEAPPMPPTGMMPDGMMPAADGLLDGRPPRRQRNVGP